jgi:imidazole glycerol-phosphate synthase subunit HisH
LKRRIVILDYGIGNVRSISNAFERIGADPILTNDSDTLMNADAVVLPGVGAFGKGMSNLNERGLVPEIHGYVATGRPFFGICLGMQLLMDESEEFGLTQGLGLIKGKVKRMPVTVEQKLPHVSWNGLLRPDVNKWRGTFLDTVPENANVYFVHSFVAVPNDENDILARTTYGGVSRERLTEVCLFVRQ